MRAREARVLIADDEEGVLQSTALLLAEEGFEVTLASRPDEILRLLRRHRPRLLLQDVRMPGLVLEDLVAAIRRDPELKGVGIILFSAALEIAEVAEAVGADAYVEKPFEARSLVAVLRSVLAAGDRAGGRQSGAVQRDK